MTGIESVLPWLPLDRLEWLMSDKIEDLNSCLSDVRTSSYIADVVVNGPAKSAGGVLNSFATPTLFLMQEVSHKVALGYGWVLVECGNLCASDWVGPARVLRARFMKCWDSNNKLHYIQTMVLREYVLIATITPLSDGILHACSYTLTDKESGKVVKIFSFDLRRSCQFCMLRGETCFCPRAIRRRHDEQMKSERFEEFKRKVVKAPAPTELDMRTFFEMHCSSFMEGIWTGNLGGERESIFEFKTVHEGERLNVCRESVLSFELNRMQISSGGSMSSVHSSRQRQGSGRFPCPRCPNTFSRRFDMKRHVGAVHMNIRPHACPHCSKAFKQTAHLKLHHLTYHVPNKQRCEACKNEFPSLSRLKRHVETVHLNLHRYTCDNCSGTWKERSHMQKHRLTCNGKRPRRGRTSGNSSGSGHQS
eukprot:Plantae.Rhodophyta-Purpureofilum_apyrenoidigerum.ctg2472.p1 GENE.Plantae.Rhodophyta-Purpureofilum_apyrenoidigerum.ctg2472~~Plantae.Rhodophyta-Purpureofilum_apyrenoidigerum.ctg2472.p1  ORF type:complete len:420 (-),score=51.70 Plantae.Rhodophyta-Purpureofilum_apyrenoidigerum.ctg2472:237-1496(-)